MEDSFGKTSAVVVEVVPPATVVEVVAPGAVVVVVSDERWVVVSRTSLQWVVRCVHRNETVRVAAVALTGREVLDHRACEEVHLVKQSLMTEA